MRIVTTGLLTLALLSPAYGQQFLGNFNSNPNDPNSIANPSGPYGSQNSPLSTNNPSGIYGSPNSPLSAHNPNITGGPRLYAPGPAQAGPPPEAPGMVPCCYSFDRW